MSKFGHRDTFIRETQKKSASLPMFIGLRWSFRGVEASYQPSLVLLCSVVVWTLSVGPTEGIAATVLHMVHGEDEATVSSDSQYENFVQLGWGWDGARTVPVSVTFQFDHKWVPADTWRLEFSSSPETMLTILDDAMPLFADGIELKAGVYHVQRGRRLPWSSAPGLSITHNDWPLIPTLVPLFDRRFVRAYSAKAQPYAALPSVLDEFPDEFPTVRRIMPGDPAGRFEVLEAVYGANGDVLSFAADFEQFDWTGRRALYGQIRHNSTIPIPEPATKFLMAIGLCAAARGNRLRSKKRRQSD
jgi:hypothetical protein